MVEVGFILQGELSVTFREDNSTFLVKIMSLKYMEAEAMEVDAAGAAALCGACGAEFEGQQRCQLESCKKPLHSYVVCCMV